MKNLLFVSLLFISTFAFASLDKGVMKATLAVDESFNINTLDQVGSTLKNSKNGDILRHHCHKRDKTGQCKEIIHVLSTNNKDLVLHDRKHQEINQNVSFIQERLNFTFRESLLNFTDFDPVYRRNAGDFTGYLGVSCMYEPKTCGLLVLLPVAIAADLVMMPIDITINESQRFKTRKKAKFFMENLNSDEEMIELNNRSFLSLLKGLSQF
jgi:hypothetical protein